MKSLLYIKLPLPYITFHFLIHFISFYYITSLKTSSNLQSKDPFVYLGIEQLNSKKLLDEVNDNFSKTNEIDKPNYSIPRLTSLDDLPSFFKLSHLYESEALPILSKFLIQDDIVLQKNGVIYDQTGFDGINRIELIHPKGSDERLKQRARSAANIFIRKMYNNNNMDYDAFGAEEDKNENINGWKVYNVLMIGSRGDNMFVKVCLPIDESVPAMCNRNGNGNNNKECKSLVGLVEKQKVLNKDYLDKIRETNFFKKNNKESVNIKKEKEIISHNNNNTNVYNTTTIMESNKEIAFKQKDNNNNNDNSLIKEYNELKQKVNKLQEIIQEKDKIIKTQEEKIIKLSKL